MPPTRALSAPSSLRPSQERSSQPRADSGTRGTFLTDIPSEESQSNPRVQKSNELVRRIAELSEKAAELSQMTSSLARKTTSKGKTCQATRSSSLVSFPRSKSPSSARGKYVHSKERLLQKALFLHKEPDYYDCFPVKPGSLWFRALYQQVSVHDSRVGKSLLSTLDIGLVETLCFVDCKCLLVYGTGRSVEVYSNDTAAAEFKRLALAWSEACGGPKGDPVVVQKKHCNGYKNLCEPLNYEELEAALLRVSGEEEIVVFQRFVRGRSEPSLLRVAWRESLSPYGFRLKSTLSADNLRSTDKKVHWTVSSDLPGIQATELKSIPSRVTQIVEQVAHFTQMVFGMQLSQLVVDVLQDEEGHYHMCQVKAFTAHPRWFRFLRSGHEEVADAWQDGLREKAPQIKQSTSRSNSARRSKKAMVPSASCTMCTCTRPLSQLQKRMTPKMMLETEHHMRKRGVQLFHIARLRPMQLSELCPVCDACWSLYLAEAELMRAEAKLAKAVGIDLEAMMAEESYVPFGGVLSSIRSERNQADYGGVHRRRDPFRNHDPLPAQSQQTSALDDGQSRAEGSAERSQLPRRGGEALVYSEDIDNLPVSRPVPSSVLQWRLMIHLNRFMDLAPELVGQHSKLILRVQVPWRPEKPHQYDLPAMSAEGDIQMHCTLVHFLFSDATSHRPLHQLLSESLLSFTLLGEAKTPAAVGIPGTSDATQSHASASAPRKKLMSGEISLARMLDSNPDGFLAQTWVMMCRQGEGDIQCQLKMTLGLVCDQPVSTEYVALQSYADSFVPCRDYFGSEALPMTWVASIMGDRPSVPGGAIEYRNNDDEANRQPSTTSERRASMEQRVLLRSTVPSILETPSSAQQSSNAALTAVSSGSLPVDVARGTPSPYMGREPEYEAEPEYQASKREYEAKPDDPTDKAMMDEIDEVVNGLHRLAEKRSSPSC